MFTKRKIIYTMKLLRYNNLKCVIKYGVYMKKGRKGLTLIALVVTIIVLLIVVAIAITLTSGENGLFSKASTSSYNNALAELYDRSYAEISYLVIPDKVDGTDNFNFENLYNSKGFTTFYEIKNGKIWDKNRKLELIGKEEFEKKIRERFEKEGKESAKPIVNAITNEDTKISGSGQIGATIYVNIGGNQYVGTVDNNAKWNITIPVQTVGTIINVTQKEKEKIVSTETMVEVVKAKLEPITINEVINTDTNVMGSARPNANISIVIGSTEYTGIADGSRKIYYINNSTI